MVLAVRDAVHHKEALLSYLGYTTSQMAFSTVISIDATLVLVVLY